MGDRYAVSDVAEALRQREMPAITTWNRLEGRPRTVAFDRALKAEVRDAVWMLARQWQMGEFQGEDAGSPCEVRTHLATTRLTRYRPRAASVRDIDATTPLEPIIEQRPVALDWTSRPIALDLRLLMGRYWLRLVERVGPYRAEYLRLYRIQSPDPAEIADAELVAHVEARQLFAAADGRMVDGGALYRHLTVDGGAASDGVALADPAHRGALDAAGVQFVRWFRRLIRQPDDASADAWIPERLEYRFACAAPEAAGERTYVAEQYFQGTLDWYSVDRWTSAPALGAVATGKAPGVSTLSMVPDPVEFDGMPNTRWWAFEDGRVNLGAVDAATTDLAKLLFLEFALVYANDWFVVPCSIEAGTIATVRGLTVRTVFGERFWIEPAGSQPTEAWQRWSMFTTTVKRPGAADGRDSSLLLLPVAGKVLEGKPLEEVLFVRDEVANMVWAVERTVALATGQGARGSEAATQLRAYFEDRARATGAGPAAPPSPYAAPVSYLGMTSVPEHWIPFIPVHVPGSSREVQLQRAAMLRVIAGSQTPPAKVRPRTSLLRTGLDTPDPPPYLIHEEEVPRAGVRVIQAFQRTRTRDGSVIVWLGARKLPGRGEGSSGLAFDQLVDSPPRGE